MAKHVRRRKSSNPRKREPPELYLHLYNSWTWNSDRQEPNVDWKRVVKDVKENVRITWYQDEDHQGMLLLHIVCALKPPLWAVSEILDANPQALGRHSFGLLPLHIAVGRNADASVVRQLIDQNPQSLLVPDRSGHTALAWACREDVSTDLVKIILEFNPTLATRPASYFGSPLEFIFQQHHYYRTAHTVPQWLDNQWTKLTYLMWAAHYGTVVARQGMKLSTLHAALAIPCPSCIIEDATRLHAQEASETRDHYGNYPLHYAVKTSNASRKVVLELLKYFPPAAALPDARGRLPLHEALNHGRDWEEGIEDIYRAYQAANTEMDKTTSVFPAQLAAAASCDVTTIFVLLREFPQQVIHKIEDRE